ncbi:hypothetical protein [Roseovarius salinarum]|uniref:hypothetical protein n=1 Tax=Roseovarius salinarum TaxID=1981892 RepID=UPI000C34696D|nr:hypothetical protein [Roseovarius salinarum]
MNRLVSAAGVAALVAALAAAASAQEEQAGGKVAARYEALPWVELAVVQGGGLSVDATCRESADYSLELLPFLGYMSWTFRGCVCDASQEFARGKALGELSAIAQNPGHQVRTEKSRIFWHDLEAGETRDETVYCYNIEALAQEYGLR